MVIHELAVYRSTLSPGDRAILDTLALRVAAITLGRNVKPWGKAVAARIQAASSGLSEVESEALAAYSMATIAQALDVTMSQQSRSGVGVAILGLAGAASSFSAYLPGGAVIASSAGQIGSIGGSMAGAAGGSASVGSPGTMSGIGGSAATSQASIKATQGMQEMQMSFNMQYLQLRNSMQNENRQFTMVSNIMKTKHDTVRNTIGNIH